MVWGQDFPGRKNSECKGPAVDGPCPLGGAARRCQAVTVMGAGREAGGGRLCRVRWPSSRPAGLCTERWVLTLVFRGSRGPGVVAGGWVVGGHPLGEWRQDQGLRGEAGHLAGLRVHGLVWGTRWGECEVPRPPAGPTPTSPSPLCAGSPPFVTTGGAVSSLGRADPEGDFPPVP